MNDYSLGILINMKRPLLAHLVGLYLLRSWTFSLLDASVLVFIYTFQDSKNCFNCLECGVIQGILLLVKEALGLTFM